MIRIIVQITDTGDACHIGGPVHVRYKSFDVDSPELEKLLKNWTWSSENKVYGSAVVVGAEVIEK